jgi:hypothetical protein
MVVRYCCAVAAANFSCMFQVRDLIFDYLLTKLPLILEVFVGFDFEALVRWITFLIFETS